MTAQGKMVYLHFPTTLTNEELLLKDKYAILRKKKKALQEMKTPKPEPEKVNPLKRPLDPKDAKELAKKLIQSGRVSIPTKPTVEKTVFKRSRILERKLSSTGRTEGHGGLTPGYSSSYHAEPHFEPFTPHPYSHSNQGYGGEKETKDIAEAKNKPSPTQQQPKYSLGAPSVDPASSAPLPMRPTQPQPQKKFNLPKKDNNYPDASPGPRQNKPLSIPKRGPTIYVGAQNLTEDKLKTVFEEFGKIVNIKIHSTNVGFVTFETAEIAEKAITDVNGNARNNITYDVQFARRQPNISQILNESSASVTWTTLAANPSNKSSHDDRRKQVVYDDDPTAYLAD